MTKKRVQAVYVLSFTAAAVVTTQLLLGLAGGALVGDSNRPIPVVNVRSLVPSREEFGAKHREQRSITKDCGDVIDDTDEVECPDVNDPKAVRAFFEKVRPSHAAAPAKAGLAEEDLTDKQREILDQYLDEERCPQSLRRVAPGFYQLCLSLVVPEKRGEIDIPLRARAVERRRERIREETR
ncbi:MAG: hypothetical protein G01um101425_798 [Candidatus Peregrinibacteria bacterium Gr01-1014_25]|nr:MAG: hypothetical protein G01um101425_798 [Candidatus Peregrinibacteria bacterium Gr01-1014_25]